MKRLLIIIAILGLQAVRAHAQFAPQAGIAGSDAVAAGSATIAGWANACHVQRGLQQIGVPGSGYAQAGDSTLALGAADGSVVSLGDSGMATVTFAHPLTDRPGADFAVFENGFLNANNTEEAFLELAFVEVSSDGINFFRFPAVSLTQETRQLSSVIGQDFMDARLLHNLAGKYISGYGTPFDLSVLANTPGLDVNRVTHVRVIDVTGDVGVHASLDSAGHKINDPFPTAFPTGGFDLDAVAAIHWLGPTGVPAVHAIDVHLFPNPAGNLLTISAPAKAMVQARDAMGRLVLALQTAGTETLINTSAWPSGIYYLIIEDENRNRWAGKVSRQ